MTAWSSHPVPVARAAELRKWIDSGEYARILGGDYPRRDDDGNASVTEESRRPPRPTGRTFSRSQDPLVGLLRRLGDGAADLGDWAGGGASRARDWADAASDGGTGSTAAATATGSGTDGCLSPSPTIGS